MPRSPRPSPATVVIHVTAHTPIQLADLRDGGACLVWSPQSNLRLYGQTTGAADVLDLGLPLAVGADWLLSGLVLPRAHADPRSGLPSHPVNVELVTIDGDLAYGRTDWVHTLGADPARQSFEDVWTLGQTHDARPQQPRQPQPKQPDPDADPDPHPLTEAYPPVGPIWA